eukprot:5221894-Pleurochrysis_carterae.AAC.2
MHRFAKGLYAHTEGSGLHPIVALQGSMSAQGATRAHAQPARQEKNRLAVRKQSTEKRKDSARNGVRQQSVPRFSCAQRLERPEPGRI